MNFIEKMLAQIAGKRLLKLINQKFQNMEGSWKTSVIGWLSVAIAVFGLVVGVLTGQGFDLPALIDAFGALEIVLPAWLIGVLGIFARDNDKSSEDVGAKT